MTLGPVGARMKQKLADRLSPVELEVMDESSRHAGHAGSRPEGETHFAIKITASAFAGLGPVQRHRMVNEILAEELSGPVHALSISAKAP